MSANLGFLHVDIHTRQHCKCKSSGLTRARLRLCNQVTGSPFFFLTQLVFRFSVLILVLECIVDKKEQRQCLLLNL